MKCFDCGWLDKEVKNMISNPKHGWCDFILGDFYGSPSYLTDVPNDLLDAFISYHANGYGIAWFDEEGTEFTLVITPYSIFIIEEKDKPILYDFSEVNVEDLEKELIEDIEKNLEGWSEFSTDDDEEEITEHLSEIERKIMMLKNR